MREKKIIGIDLGGTFVKFGLFDTEGNLLRKWQVPTGERSRAHVFQLIADEVEVNGDSAQIQAIGIGVPGSVNEDGIMINAPNLGWSMVDFQKEMRAYLDVPVYVGNDANVAALGEQFFGIGHGCDSMVFVTLGTGVGGGVIVNQRLVAGAFGGGGEIGHMVINPQETVACTCGNCGCLEQYASATGIARIAAERLADKTRTSVLRECPQITAKEVFDAVRGKDALAIEVADVFGQTLGRALAMVASVTDPQMFVIGGGVSAAGDVLLEYIEKYYRKYAFAPSKQTEFRIASLGNDAGILGAARLALLG